MASFNIHIAAGILYAEKNKINNIDEFYSGILEPDLCEDKNLAHYTHELNKTNLIKYLKEKVTLVDFLNNNKDLKDNYTKG